MSNFKLDTSGEVMTTHPALLGWLDLSPFEQGYVEGAARAIAAYFREKLGSLWNGIVRYDMLAPETLTRIREDCRIASELPCYRQTPSQTYAGRVFWLERQSDFLPNFAPITVYLGDDGKVMFQ